MSAIKLSDSQTAEATKPVIGVFATGDPRVDQESRARCVNIVEMGARVLADRMQMADGSAVKVVYSPILVDGEKEADMVARQLQAEGANILVCLPDTWAFPQLGLISLLSQFPADTPVNLTCGNAGPKPGVVFAHAVNGALAQSGRLTHLNVGTWRHRPSPQMTEDWRRPVDWAYAAVASRPQGGRGDLRTGQHGLDTPCPHSAHPPRPSARDIPLDMKLLADMLKQGGL